MTSVRRAPDGTCDFEYGDGLPFGHELAAAITDGAPPEAVTCAADSLRVALNHLQQDSGPGPERRNSIKAEYIGDAVG